MRQASNSSWPEIQKYHIERAAKDARNEGDPFDPFYTTDENGAQTLNACPDSWWLRNFSRSDVLLELPGVVIMNTKPWHIRSVCNTLWDAYGLAEDSQDSVTEIATAAHVGETPPATVYGTSGDFARLMQDMPVGAIFRTIGFMSTSADPAVAAQFSRVRVAKSENWEGCFDERDILAHIERFPEGQFAAQRISGPTAGNCVGMATTMRTSRLPTAPILSWREAIGDMTLAAHEPDGDWLYGVELAVHPMYQRHGIATGLYQARFELVRNLNLLGWYAVGMLMGYTNHALDIVYASLEGEQKAIFERLLLAIEGEAIPVDERREAQARLLSSVPRYSDLMDVTEYGNRVIAGQIKDPTVTMQMNRGFRAERVITDYVDEPAAGNAGVLIVWENPDFVEKGA
ncbi:MAG: GNAT family N-acetyltransferase [Chloroflexi bacterium]|nr:GNAT family N-acetyltransferase [Chloroflexota bacterium]